MYGERRRKREREVERESTKVEEALPGTAWSQRMVSEVRTGQRGPGVAAT